MKNTVKVRTKYQVTIPEAVRNKIPLEIGERVEVTSRGNEIIIKPMVEVPREQAWFYQKEWQELEKQATKDKKTGKTKSFDNPEEAIKWLKS